MDLKKQIKANGTVLDRFLPRIVPLSVSRRCALLALLVQKLERRLIDAETKNQDLEDYILQS